MKLKKLFALALAVCIMALVVPGAFAAGLTLDYGTTTNVVEDQIPVVYNTGTTNRMGTVDAEGLITSKDAVYDPNSNSATITIEAYTIGDAETETKPVPTDIVLLLDESKSMETSAYEYKPITFTKNESNMNTSATYYVLVNGSYVAVKYCTEPHLVQTIGDGWYTGTHWGFHWGSYYAPIKQSYSWWEEQKDNAYNVTRVQFYERTEVNETKIELLKAEAIDFVEEIAKDAATKDVAHRVSIVNFSSSATVEIGLVDDIRNNLGAVTDTTNSTVIGAINSLALTNNAANISDALVKAQSALSSSDSTRNKVVVLFTNYGGYSTDVVDENSVGAINDAIFAAAALKAKAVGADVYAIGMMEHADSTLDVLDSDIDSNGQTYEKSVLINRMMQYVSSNFPSAASLTSPGDKTSSNYYVAASDAASLQSIFSKILKSVQEQVTETELSLDATTQIIDNIMPQFGAPTSVTFESYNCKSYEKGKEPTWYTEDKGASGASYSYKDGTVTVTGFNFDNYYLTDEAKTDIAYKDAPKGRKLVIKIVVPRNNVFLGGNGVYTNDEFSGVYKADRSLVELFDRPTVDVPVKTVTPVMQPQTIYLSNTADLTALVSGFDSLNRINGTNNSHAMITYELRDSTNNLVAKFEIGAGETAAENSWNTDITKVPGIAGCTPYTLTCTVNGGGTNKITSNPATATVHVRKPSVAANETTTYIGNSVELPAGMVSGWFDEDEPAGTNVQGSAPTNFAWNYYNGETLLGVNGTQFTASDAACDTLIAVLSINGNAYDKAYSNTYTVHVLTPTLNAHETAIYLSDKVNLNERTYVETWNNCGDGKGKGDIPYGTTEPTPTNCTFKVDDNRVDAQYTNTSCKTVNATWSLGTERYSIGFTVHVLEPNFKLNDDTIYYGGDADLKPTVEGWACGGHSLITTPSPTATAPAMSNRYQYSVGQQPVSLEDMTDCKKNVYAWVELGGKEVKSSNEVDVHVLKPTITAKDHTLYWTQSYSLNGSMTTDAKWKCKHTDNEKTVLGTAPAPDFTFTNNGDVATDETDLVLDDCTTYTVTAKINGVDFPLTNNSFTVHVVKPVISCADTAIYLGNSVNLNAQVTEDPAWECTTPTCLVHKTLAVMDKDDNKKRVAPELDHTFSTGSNEAMYQPETCTGVTVTSVISTGNVNRDVTPTQNTFTVHVFVPQFTVTTQDLWADCGANVDLNLARKSNPTWTWVDRKNDGCTLTATGEQDVESINIQFDPSNPINPMGESDVDVNVNSLTCKVNSVTYTAVKADSAENGDKQLSVTKAVHDEKHDFTVHVNKFKAIITNKGTQNAIYTLSNDTKVAVEAGKSTTVAGLICGKEYTISEDADNDWTWRYGTAASAKDAYENEKESISFKVNQVKASATPESSDSVFMTYGDITNTKWLAGEDCVVNKATTQATITNPALSVKKKEEEVTTA